jgi:hypothetical protein
VRRRGWVGALLVAPVVAGGCGGGAPDVVACELLDRAAMEDLLGEELVLDPSSPDRREQRVVRDGDGKRTGTRTVEVDDPGRCFYVVDLAGGRVEEIDTVDVTIGALGGRSFDVVADELRTDLLIRTPEGVGAPIVQDLPELGDDARAITRRGDEGSAGVLVKDGDDLVYVSVTTRGRATAVAIAREVLHRLERHRTSEAPA